MRSVGRAVNEHDGAEIAARMTTPTLRVVELQGLPDSDERDAHAVGISTRLLSETGQAQRSLHDERGDDRDRFGHDEARALLEAALQALKAELR